MAETERMQVVVTGRDTSGPFCGIGYGGAVGSYVMGQAGRDFFFKNMSGHRFH
jgi:hypothetical protein